MNYLNFRTLLAGLLLPALALGLPEDRDQPIQLEADSAELDQKTGISVYRGNVVVTQGSMRLTADTATVYIEDDGFQRAEAVGTPTTFRYKPAADKKEISGIGDRLTYDTDTDLVVVTGNAKITQGQDEFTGDYIEYDLNMDMIRAKSTIPGQRIKIIIQPRKNN